MNANKKYALIILFMLSANLLNAQQLNIPLGQQMSERVASELNAQKEAVNTGFKPLRAASVTGFDVDSVLYQQNRKDEFNAAHKKNWFNQTAFFNDFVTVEKENFKFYVNPLFYVESGQIQDSSHRMLINTRGIEFKGEIGKNLAFYSSFRENYSEFRPYIHEWAAERLVIPGQGATKSSTTTNTFDDYSMASGYLSYSPVNSLNIQIGQGKHFIGEGYRSLLLSDNSFNYPYLKLTYTKNGFQYTSLMTEFQDFSVVYYYPHIKKHGAFNYLSYNLKNRVELGLFEGVIYKTNDTAAHIYNQIPADYFIPLIGLKTVVNNDDENNNLMTGLNLKLKLTQSSQLYGQLAFDMQEARQSATQIGLKIFDVFHRKLKHHKLYFQTEYNKANGTVYSNFDKNYSPWTHYNQELAHPLGTQFEEFVLITRYSFRNFTISYHRTHAVSPDGNSDIFKQGILYDPIFALESKTVNNTIITATWIFNPRTNLQIYGGIHTRDVIYADNTNSEPYIFFGIKTGINNFYYDF